MPESFLNKVAGLSPATLLKKRLWHRCFPLNFAKFSRTPFLQNSSGDCFCTLSREIIGHYQTVHPPPLTLTHPLPLTPTHPHPAPSTQLHSPKIMPHLPTPTPQKCPTHPHPPKIMSHPPKTTYTHSK